MSDLSAYSENYATARARFQAAALTGGYDCRAYTIDQTGPKGEDLSIDVAISGAAKPDRVVVISSGLHGIEGFLGSAIQLAFLQNFLTVSTLPAGLRIVLIHALNPYGFAWRRRWNEDNIDLNRNFLLPAGQFVGSPQFYPDFNDFLNPTTPPSRWEPYFCKAIALILQHGMTRLKNTLPAGQYDFPQGLFWGGHEPAKTQQILATHLPEWIARATDVLHLDFHSGLGAWSTYKLLISAQYQSDQHQSETFPRLAQRFGPKNLESANPAATGVSYQIQGGLGDWCQALLPHCRYDFLTVEFGTYPAIQVLKALRAENRAHWWGQPGHNYEWTKKLLFEMFIPISPQWRKLCLSQGLELCQQALFET